MLDIFTSPNTSKQSIWSGKQCMSSFNYAIYEEQSPEVVDLQRNVLCTMVCSNVSFSFVPLESVASICKQ